MPEKKKKKKKNLKKYVPPLIKELDLQEDSSISRKKNAADPSVPFLAGLSEIATARYSVGWTLRD